VAKKKRKNEALYNNILGGELDHLPPEKTDNRARFAEIVSCFPDENNND
jgi:hypothetical protein